MVVLISRCKILIISWNLVKCFHIHTKSLTSMFVQGLTLAFNFAKHHWLLICSNVLQNCTMILTKCALKYFHFHWNSHMILLKAVFHFNCTVACFFVSWAIKWNQWLQQKKNALVHCDTLEVKTTFIWV